MQLDVKGAAALAVSITSFLLCLTMIETSNGLSTGSNSVVEIFSTYGTILGSAILAATSFILFLLIEKRERYPLIDLRLLGNKAILPSMLIILIVGLSNFMVFQTIPILVRNPEPIGFGADVVYAGTIQLPFALVFLVFGPTSGLIISKLGSLRPVITGTSIITASFLGLVLFHDSPTAISINLGVLATGLSFGAYRGNECNNTCYSKRTYWNFPRDCNLSEDNRERNRACSSGYVHASKSNCS